MNDNAIIRDDFNKRVNYRNYGNVDMFTIIKFYIRNMVKLNDPQLLYIDTLSNEQKMEIIKLYNVVLFSVTEYAFH